MVAPTMAASAHSLAIRRTVAAGTVLSFSAASGVYCFDLQGNKLWETNVGSGTHGWGSATSPLLYKDLLIVNAGVESQSLVALNKKTGQEVWRASGISRSWSSPMLVDVSGGKQ